MKDMLAKFMVVAIFTACNVVSVQAQGIITNDKPNTFTYDYLDVEYVDIDEFDTDGFRLSGSYDFEQNLSVIGSIVIAEGNKVDYTQLTGGLAYHQQIKDTETDLVLHAEIEMIDWDFDSKSSKKDDDDTGILIGSEVRHKINVDAELYGDLSLRTTGDNDVLLTFGGRLHFTPKLLGIVSYEISDQDILAVGIRYHF